MGPDKNESWLSLVSGHVVSRTVRDSALVLDLTKGPSQGAPYGPTKGIPNFTAALNSSVKGKKIAFTKQSLFGEHVDSECVEALSKTMKVCEDLGLEVVEDQPSFDKQDLVLSYYILIAASVAGDVSRFAKLMGTKASLENIEHATWFLKVAGEKLRASHLEHALYVIRQATLLWENFLTKYDFFSTPTIAYEPSPIGLMNIRPFEKAAIHLADYLPLSVILSTLKQIGTRGIEKTPNTSIFNMSGHPAMSVPTHWSRNQIPIGIQFVGRMGEDQHLFSLASALEGHFSWEQKVPPR
jgi:amidase